MITAQNNGGKFNGEWGQVSYNITGQIAGTHSMAEGGVGVDLATHERLDGVERTTRIAGGTGQFAGWGAGGAGLTRSAVGAGSFTNLPGSAAVSRVSSTVSNGVARVTPAPIRNIAGQVNEIFATDVGGPIARVAPTPIRNALEKVNGVLKTNVEELLPGSRAAIAAGEPFVVVDGRLALNPGLLEMPTAAELSAGGIEPLFLGRQGIAISPLAEGMSIHGIESLPNVLLEAEVAAMRLMSPSRGNFSVTILESESGQVSLLRGASGNPSKQLQGFVLAREIDDRLLGTIEVPTRHGTMRTNAFDPETLTLEEIMRAHQNSTIRLLYSENPICDGCNFAIDQFEVLNNLGRPIPTRQGIPRSTR